MIMQHAMVQRKAVDEFISNISSKPELKPDRRGGPGL